MFARLSVATVAFALALPFALASPTPSSLEARSDVCNSGSLQCCNKTTNANSSSASAIAGLLGITGSLGPLVGLQCSPVNVIGFGSNSCTQQTVCCSNNNFNGVVAFGCSPTNIGL